MTRTILLLIILALTGCANPFVKFYQDRTGGIDLTKVPTVILPTGEPKLFQGSNPDTDHQRILEDGFNLIGFSSFNGGNVNINDALTQAKAVYAEMVVIYSKHTGTNSGVLPLTLPNSQTSTTTLSGSSFGTGGYGSFYGTANTTTYGSQTTYIPYSVDRYDYFATYWIKIKPPVFGIHPRDLPPEIKQQIGSNKGVLVYAVIKNSPAFRADILKGDILRKIGDLELYDPKSFQEAVGKYAGQKVIVQILRDGKEIQKEIQLDQKR
jgi:hypothetical protein